MQAGNGIEPAGDEKLAGNMAFVGSRKKHGNRARNRLWMAMACFVGIYGVMGGKLIYFGVIGGENEESAGPAVQQLASRPDILDRQRRNYRDRHQDGLALCRTAQDRRS
jgi:cell division protein FtsI (penicillin-binding protein 3)